MVTARFATGCQSCYYLHVEVEASHTKAIIFITSVAIG